MTVKCAILGLRVGMTDEIIKQMVNKEVRHYKELQYLQQSNIKNYSPYNIQNTNILKNYYNKQISKGNYFYRK